MKTEAITIRLVVNKATISPWGKGYFDVKLEDVDIDAIIDEVGERKLLEAMNFKDIEDFVNE
jgi:hypothetical protein